MMFCINVHVFNIHHNLQCQLLVCLHVSIVPTYTIIDSQNLKTLSYFWLLLKHNLNIFKRKSENLSDKFISISRSYFETLSYQVTASIYGDACNYVNVSDFY